MLPLTHTVDKRSNFTFNKQDNRQLHANNLCGPILSIGQRCCQHGSELLFDLCHRKAAKGA